MSLTGVCPAWWWDAVQHHEARRELVRALRAGGAWGCCPCPLRAQGPSSPREMRKACFLASGAGCTWGQSRSTGKCNCDHMHKAIFSFSTHVGAAARHLCILCSVAPREAPMGPQRRAGQPGELGRAAGGEGGGSKRRNFSIINESSVAPCLPKRNTGLKYNCCHCGIR